MPKATVGLLHPGEMGVTVGAAAKSAGGRVVWASEDRSPSSRSRASAHELEDLESIDRLVAAADFVISVCPPHSALEVARSVAMRRFPGVYIDANAVSPATTRTIAGMIENAGGTFVDGGIIGPPAAKSDTTRLYLSGREAARVAELFHGSVLEPVQMNAPIGAASALKMAYSSWTKGSAALLIALRAFAISEGIDADLLAEWRRSIPDLQARSERTLNLNARNAWRFVGEMDEIADTFKAAGFPAGFPLAAKEIYQRLGHYKHASSPPSFAEVANDIRASETVDPRGEPTGRE
jgi:3-hydroxyisobutyrate dehydrogenase-like beta-hydroxyacid dehydrogenase